MKETIIGVDLSLVSTGIAILRGSNLETRRIIPVGNTRREKLASIYDQFSSLWKELGYIDLIVLEEPLVSRYIDIVVKILAVHGAFIASLGAANCIANIITVHPTSLKKYATGNGKAQKEDIRRAIEAKTGKYLQNDEADAATCAYIGKGIGTRRVKFDEQKLSKLKNPQIEEDIYNQFGLSIQKVKAMRAEKAKLSRKKYKEKKSCEKKSN